MPDAGFAFFTPAQAGTIAAAAARIFPSDDLGPGATEAGVVRYVDRALAGHDRELRDTYRRGVALLDRLARARADRPFRDCPPEVQDDVLAAIEGGVPEGVASGAPRAGAGAGPAAPPGDPFPARFFRVLLDHTREGMFSDPVHGGNRDMLGWRLLGHPGVQVAYDEADFAPGAVVDRPPRSLSDFLASREP